MRRVPVTRNACRADIVEAAQAGADATPVQSCRPWDAHAVWRAHARGLCRENRRVDVRGEVVVVDEDTDSRVTGCPGSEDVEAEMQRSILGDVVVRYLIGDGQARDSLSVACLDDSTESATTVSEGTICGEIEISMVCRGWVSNVRCR
jgi:hypothetical protein